MEMIGLKPTVLVQYLALRTDRGVAADELFDIEHVEGQFGAEAIRYGRFVVEPEKVYLRCSKL